MCLDCLVWVADFWRCLQKKKTLKTFSTAMSLPRNPDHANRDNPLTLFRAVTQEISFLLNYTISTCKRQCASTHDWEAGWDLNINDLLSWGITLVILLSCPLISEWVHASFCVVIWKGNGFYYLLAAQAKCYLVPLYREKADISVADISRSPFCL